METSYTADGILNLHSHYGKKQTVIPQKIKNRTTIWSSNSTSGNISKGNENTISKIYMHPYAHYSIIYNSQDMEAT